MKLKRILSTLLLLSLLFTLLVGCANASAEGTLPPMGSMHTNETTSGEEAVTTRAATTAPKRGIPTDGIGGRTNVSDVPLSQNEGYLAYLTDAQIDFIKSIYGEEIANIGDIYEFASASAQASWVLSHARASLFSRVADSSAREAQACGSNAQAKYEALKSRATKTVTYALYGQKLEETDYEVEILYENDLLIGAVVLKVGTNGEKTLANTGSDALSTLCNGDNKALFEMAVGTLVAVPEFDVMGFAIVSYGTKVYLAPIGIYDNYGYMEYADPESSWFDFYTFAPERFATVEEGRAILAK